MLTTKTIEQRVTQLEAELERLGRLLKSDRFSTSIAQPAQAIDLPFGVFAKVASLGRALVIVLLIALHLPACRKFSKYFSLR
jgi:hypothetical protein